MALMEVPQKVSYEIDLKKLVASAEAAGFNPLTVLRNGGAAGFMIENHPSLLVDMGSFSPTTPGYGDGGHGEQVDAGGHFGGGGGGSIGGTDSGLDVGDAFDWVEHVTGDKVGGVGGKTGIGSASKGGTFAVPSHLAPSVVVTDTRQPKTVIGMPASPGVPKTAGPAAPRVVTAGAPSSKTKPDKAALEGIDVYGIGWGLTWESPNTFADGQEWEDGYGDLGGSAIGAIKLIYDVGWNAERLGRFAQQKTGIGTTRPQTRLGSPASSSSIDQVWIGPNKGAGQKQVGTSVSVPYTPPVGSPYGKSKPTTSKTTSTAKPTSSKTKGGSSSGKTKPSSSAKSPSSGKSKSKT